MAAGSFLSHAVFFPYLLFPPSPPPVTAHCASICWSLSLPRAIWSLILLLALRVRHYRPPPLPNRKCHSRASVLRGPVLLVFLFVGFHPLASCVMKSGYLLTRSSIQSLIQNLLAPSVRCLARPRRRTMFSHFPLLFLLPVLMSFWVGRFSLLSSFRAKPLLSGA